MFGENTRELGWFVKAGMTPSKPSAPHHNAADLLGKPTELGAVAPGYSPTWSPSKATRSQTSTWPSKRPLVMKSAR